MPEETDSFNNIKTLETVSSIQSRLGINRRAAYNLYKLQAHWQIRPKINRTPERHSLSGSSEYKIWAGMKDRCHNKRSTAYQWYGARGIRVCDRWRHSFINFFEDMGERPSPAHSIDRMDNDGNYQPENCRWATRKEQANNQRRYRKLPTEYLTVETIADRLGVSVRMALDIYKLIYKTGEQ